MAFTVAVTAIGRDRPGIVAGISGALADLGANVEDARMAILRGNFAVMLVAALPGEDAVGELEERLEGVREELGLDAITVSEVTEKPATPEPTHVLTVYGADHPGIVHSFAVALAEHGVNITDLQARLVDSGETAIYALMMEIEPRAGTDIERLRLGINGVADLAGVDASLREIGAETL